MDVFGHKWKPTITSKRLISLETPKIDHVSSCPVRNQIAQILYSVVGSLARWRLERFDTEKGVTGWLSQAYSSFGYQCPSSFDFGLRMVWSRIIGQKMISETLFQQPKSPTLRIALDFWAWQAAICPIFKASSDVRCSAKLPTRLVKG